TPQSVDSLEYGLFLAPWAIGEALKFLRRPWQRRPAAPGTASLAASKTKALCLRVLPTLVDRLKAIAVGIENVRCIIAGIVIQAGAGLAVGNRASLHRRVVKCIDLGLALGDKADMCRPGVRIALSQPEENAAVSS